MSQCLRSVCRVPGCSSSRRLPLLFYVAFLSHSEQAVPSQRSEISTLGWMTNTRHQAKLHNRDSSVSIVTELRSAWPGIGVRFPAGANGFHFSKTSIPALRPPQVSFPGVNRPGRWATPPLPHKPYSVVVNYTTLLHLVFAESPKLKTSVSRRDQAL